MGQVADLGFKGIDTRRAEGVLEQFPELSVLGIVAAGQGPGGYPAAFRAIDLEQPVRLAGTDPSTAREALRVDEYLPDVLVPAEDEHL